MYTVTHMSSCMQGFIVPQLSRAWCGPVVGRRTCTHALTYLGTPSNFHSSHIYCYATGRPDPTGDVDLN